MITEKRFSFAVAVAVTEIDSGRLRHWLDRSLIKLDANDERPEPGMHRRFSRLDMVRLGLVAELTNLGYTTKLASAIVEGTIYDKILASPIAETTIRNLQGNIPAREKPLESFSNSSEDLRRALVLNTPESEILALLRRTEIILSPEQHEPGDESDEPMFWTTTRTKTETVTQIVINVGLMIKKQHERFREYEALRGRELYVENVARKENAAGHGDADNHEQSSRRGR